MIPTRDGEKGDPGHSAAVHPGEREQGIDEGRGEHAERMKHHAVAREPEHQPRRIGDRAELHHHEGHGEDDPRQRHHPGRCSRKEGLGRGHRHINGIVGKVGPFESRQREAGDDSRTYIEHRNEPGLHRRPICLSWLIAPISRTIRAVYGIADEKTQGSPLGARPSGRDPPRPCAGSTGETQFQAASIPKFGYDVGLPRSGRWLKLFNSDVYDGFPKSFADRRRRRGHSRRPGYRRLCALRRDHHPGDRRPVPARLRLIEGRRRIPCSFPDRAKDQGIEQGISRFQARSGRKGGRSTRRSFKIPTRCM